MDASARTAIARKRPSMPIRLIHENNWLKYYASIFDWGCGKGADIDYLNANGYRASGYDPAFRPENRPLVATHFGYDYVTSIYVINVVAEPQERQFLLQDMRGFLPLGGMLYIASRSARELAAEARRHNWERDAQHDGWRTGTGTFQRGYTPELLFDELAAAGYGDTILVNRDPVILLAHRDCYDFNGHRPARLITEDVGRLLDNQRER